MGDGGCGGGGGEAHCIVSVDAHRLSDVMVLSYVHVLIYFLHLSYIR